jgi:phosphoglycolate phosphatase
MMTPWNRARLRLLVFDWDGTLMDSVGSIVACTQQALADLGWGPVADQSIRTTIGLGLREALAGLMPEATDACYERLLERYRHHWHGGHRDQPFLFPGVPAMLAELKESGFLLAVATGKSRRGLDYALAQSDLSGFFDATRTADEAFSKPHPQMLLDILEELGARPGEAVMVGDTTYDLEMARNGGTASIGVCSGSHSRDELLGSGPLACLESVIHLPQWLGLGVPAAR